MSSNKSLEKQLRSHSIHATIARDLERMKRLQRLEMKQAKDFHVFERRRNIHAKWNQRADHKILGQNSINNNHNHSTMTLDEFMQHEKIKQDKIMNSKKLANERIRLK
ncbi:unnamed protein product [Rotaria sordida]|uniref:Uncharacterized protein n=1 Tax=Rotaria sordida TaxID=392033 RepID=A0A813WV93_9BILA|nr:unnamed protein product [Rotaria sordida]CAF0911827.1 unnamed protein product [Rotaria sordida]CAF3776368.1 unnamed protein product [Rotaria sordida]CAF4050065.1 unnamed protein product [Rotaria sordida]